ncbi:MAG TPA: hypothetical protein VN666_19985 [Nitrospira sp.]|nr:hypothetical protein [Nitrospira sp.]
MQSLLFAPAGTTALSCHEAAALRFLENDSFQKTLHLVERLSEQLRPVPCLLIVSLVVECDFEALSRVGNHLLAGGELVYWWSLDNG